MYVLLNPLVVFLLFTQQPAPSQPLSLKRFDVLRSTPDGMRRLPPPMRAIFSDPNSDGEPVSNLETAAKRAGFTPRMLKSPSVTQFGVIDSFTRDVTLNVSDLTDALREAKATDITVPSAWNGLVLKLHQDAGVLTDYGDFFIIQAPPLTLSGPSGFPMDQFMEVLFRIVGINSPDAHTLRERFAKEPASFVFIPTQYDMDNRQVQVTGGQGLILQNAEKGGELAFMWSTGERSYFLFGLLTEADAIAAANALAP